ncbi:SRPBCC domain-containing protein [Chryseobacterium sp. MFBS3-17]|uniref:SRPBCC domain-containing protein n=1 Tax=Chryseobacterium sp. MFBS3-17 TaxID=2886689 RepID=UPI001D0F4886|nr:SRPBCC domain-containing protein [Chryseobacterium sp. MFBS3-17]MCC2590864.1 SRPBCC domain-containing protein [Chryseobacterium sp. MFBS3-17]
MDPINIEIVILEPLEKVWNYMHDPKHITKWNFIQDNWYCPRASNDFRVGGRFEARMEAKNHSFGYDIVGVYDEIIPHQFVQYTLFDGRKVEVYFNKIDDNTTQVRQIFDLEFRNSREMQRNTWYNILNNFHKYVENN